MIYIIGVYTSLFDYLASLQLYFIDGYFLLWCSVGFPVTCFPLPGYNLHLQSQSSHQSFFTTFLPIILCQDLLIEVLMFHSFSFLA